jgi:UDP-glucose 4-epimerase
VSSVNGMTCLVIGGTGFIGRHLCRTLTQSGAAVRSLSRRGKPGNACLQVEYRQGSLSDELALREAVRGCSIVWHLASSTLPGSSLAEGITALHEEVAATLRLCEIAVEEGVGRLIFASSGGTVYGITSAAQISENHPTNPISAYGVQKLAIEKYLHLFENLHGFKSYVLRLGNPFGEDQDWHKPFGAIANFANRASRDLPIYVWGDGSVVRDYFHVDDLGDAFLRISTYEGRERIFNLGSGIGTSVKQLLSIVEELLPRPVKISYDESRRIDVPYNVLDISRAKNELGWTPRIELKEGIRRVLRSALGEATTVEPAAYPVQDQSQ